MAETPHKSHSTPREHAPSPSPKGPITLTSASIGSVIATSASITSLQMTVPSPRVPERTSFDQATGFPVAGALTLVEDADPAHTRALISLPDTGGLCPHAELVSTPVPFASLKVNSVPAGSSWTVVVG